MFRVDKNAFFVGDRFKGPKRRRRRSKYNHQSQYRRFHLYCGRINVAHGGDYYTPDPSLN